MDRPRRRKGIARHRSRRRVRPGDEDERDEEEDEDSGDEDAGDEEEDSYEDECEDDPRWRKHPRKRRGKRYDCDWVAAKARKRCKKKNKIGVRASEACECACA